MVGHPEKGYDGSEPLSILKYAKRLENGTLNDFLPAQYTVSIDGITTKGGFGCDLEKLYFGLDNSGESAPDFKDAGVELKSAPLKRLQNRSLVPKERMVLNMIDYGEMADEVFENSHFVFKNSKILMVFRIWEKDVQYTDHRIHKVLMWDLFSDVIEKDRAVIQRDWERIRDKIKEGKAHELSESDTFYLGACTKGAGRGKDERAQPYSCIKAKSRALAFKTTYLKQLIRNKRYSNDSYLYLSEETIDTPLDIEDIVRMRIAPFIGMTIDDIEDRIDTHPNRKAKGYYAALARAMMGIKGTNVAEFDKAGVLMKIIRLTKKGRPKEAMSFRAFKYIDVAYTRWDESDICDTLQNKFFMVVFKMDGTGDVRLVGANFWSIPDRDLNKVKNVYDETARRIRAGRADDLPRMSEFPVAHVRPHAQNSNDVDVTPDGKYLVKKSFWFNQDYLQGVVENDILLQNE